MSKLSNMQTETQNEVKPQNEPKETKPQNVQREVIKFVVDSTCCVPESFAKQHDISVVSLTTTLDDYVLKEGFEHTWSEFYQKLISSKNFPKTSQPAPEEFESVFNNILSQNKNAKIITVTLSASLSGTNNSANLAAQGFNKNQVAVLDSGQTAQSCLLFLEELVQLYQQGKTFEQILEASQSIRQRITIQFVPQTIEYLRRGGRINLVKATLVSLLNIKPVLSFNAGVLTNTKKGFGMHKTINEVVADIPKNIKKLYVCVVHESEWASVLISKVNQKLGLNITTAHKISPVVGSHVGPGAIGVAYITN